MAVDKNVVGITVRGPRICALDGCDNIVKLSDRKYCCKECGNKGRELSRRNTCLKKYGVDNCSKTDDVRDIRRKQKTNKLNTYTLKLMTGEIKKHRTLEDFMNTPKHADVM